MTRRRRPARARFRPSIDRLEGRALMATAGNVDTTFGTDGYFVSPIQSTIPIGLTAASVGSDGSIVAAGSVGASLGVIRLTSAGQPITSFGTNGEATIPVPSGTTLANLSAVAVTTGGQVVVAGTISTSPPTGTSTQVLIAVLNADGSLDSSYGTDGEVIIGTSGLSVDGMTFLPSSETNTAGAQSGDFLAIQPDGSVVIGGQVAAANSSSSATPAVARLDPQGVVDTSFGTSGLVQLSVSYAASEVDSVAVAPSGQILAAIAGFDNYPPFWEDSIFRLNSDGSIDGSPIDSHAFASFYQVAEESDGSVVALGEYNDTMAFFYGLLQRFNADNTQDGGIDFEGADYGFGGNQILGVQPDGSIVLGGGRISRLTPDLTPDLSFGNLGFATFPSSTIPTSSQPLGLGTVAPDGSIIAIGGEPSSFDGSVSTTYTNDVVSRLTTTSTPATPGDFTGDGISDPAFYLTGTAYFVIGNSGGGAGQVVQLGTRGLGNTIPAPGDYFATGQEDVAVYLADSGLYAIKDPTGQTPGLLLPIGVKGIGQTLPAPGDYFGVGSDQVAIYVAQSATWDILAPGLNPGLTFHFGQPGVGNTIPAPGDYFGTGADDVAVYLPRTGTWSILTPGLSSVVTVNFGIPGVGNTIPVPGDYDGSGHTELGVYLPALAELQYISGAGKVVTVPFGLSGAGQTLPEPGDYDGSGRTEVAAYFPSSGEFVYRPADGGADLGFNVGFASQGPIEPVTAVVPLALLGSSTATPSPSAIGEPAVMGEADALDFLIPLASDAKKAKPADS